MISDLPMPRKSIRVILVLVGTLREAIIDSITRPPGSPSPGASPGATTYRGGHPFQAPPETIRFLRERVDAGRAMLAVEFEDTEGRPWRYVFGADQQPDRAWKAAGGAGGGGGPEPRWPGPWANFGGWGWPRFLCVGGWVYGDDVRTVRLIDAGGRTVEDAVEGGVALLLSNDPVTMPCRIELRDPEDRLLRTQPWPPDSGRPSR